jgi:amidase
LNCCLEFPYASALARAEALDRKGGKGLGVLHGLPISVKDQVRVVGTETTCGFVGNLGKRDEENSLVGGYFAGAGGGGVCEDELEYGLYVGGDH